MLLFRASSNPTLSHYRSNSFVRKLTTILLGLMLGNLITSDLAAQAATTTLSTKAPTANIAQALSKKFQGKPVVVEIYASWCPACKNVAPTVSQLKKQYAGKANFLVLDVSDQAATSRSRNAAQQAGLSQFFSQNISQTGLVAIIDPATGNVLAQHRNNPDKSDYTSVLDAAIR
jgi:thiol-disulfide isomerase/thioredoxin